MAAAGAVDTFRQCGSRDLIYQVKN